MVDWGQSYGALLITVAAVRKRADVGGHQEGSRHGTARGNAGRQWEGPLHRRYTLKQTPGLFSLNDMRQRPPPLQRRSSVLTMADTGSACSSNLSRSSPMMSPSKS